MKIYDLREKNKVSSTTARRKFPSCNPGKGTQTELPNLAEQLRQRLEFRQAEAVRIWRAKYKRGRSCIGKEFWASVEEFLGIYFRQWSACVGWNTVRVGKELSESSKLNNSWIPDSRGDFAALLAKAESLYKRSIQQSLGKTLLCKCGWRLSYIYPNKSLKDMKGSNWSQVI